MKLIGLTGGIATGKSTVARLLRERFDVPVIDADLVAREIVAPGEPALAAIVDAFGPEALSPDGTLDRAAMRGRIRESPEARKVLEGITHPAIRARVAERVLALAAEGHPAAVVEAALLVETGGYRHYDALIVVSADPEVQVRRVMARDGSTEAQARAMLATQLPMADKEAVADVVIRNEHTLEDLEQATAEAWSQLI